MFQWRTGPTEQREQKAVESAPSHFAGSKCSVLCPLPFSTMAAFPVLEQETLFWNSTWSYRIPALLYLPRFSMILAFAEEREDLVDEHARLITMRRGLYDPATQHVQVPVQGGGTAPSSAHLPQMSWMYLPSCCRDRAASPPQVQETNLPINNARLFMTAGIQPYGQLLGGLKWSRYSRGGFDPSLRSWGCRYRDGTKVLLQQEKCGREAEMPQGRGRNATRMGRSKLAISDYSFFFFKFIILGLISSLKNNWE